MWESRRLLARFPRGSWKEGEACLWLSTLSTAPAFPQLFLCRVVARCWRCLSSGIARLWLLCTGFFLLLAVLQSVALSIHLQDVDMVCQAIQQRTGQPFRA
jgi:hypothetical protein